MKIISNYLFTQAKDIYKDRDDFIHMPGISMSLYLLAI